MQTATITFRNRHEANVFATKWTRFTKTGHTISKNKVTVYDVCQKKKDWIEGYIEYHDISDIDILKELGAI